MVNRTIELADGRRLAYTAWGHEDAPPVVYCHGFPTNGRELDLLARVLDQRNVDARVIAMNRPGYGDSTAQTDHGFLTWTRDVDEFADRLGLTSFGVLGVSGGAPFALACGYSIEDRVSRLGIAVGVAPIDAAGMSDASIATGPSRNRYIRRLQFRMTALAFDKGREERFIEQSAATMSEPDQRALEEPGVRDWFTETMRESFADGGRTATIEAALYREPWGFDLARVGIETRLWYGSDDQTVPASSGQWLADRLPNADFVLWPGEGHFTWMLTDHAADVVEWVAHG